MGRAFDDVVHVELGAHGLDVDVASLETECRVSRHHVEPVVLAHVAHDVRGDAIHQVFLVRFAGHVYEGEYQHSWAAGMRCDRPLLLGARRVFLALRVQFPHKAKAALVHRANQALLLTVVIEKLAQDFYATAQRRI